MSEHLSAQTIEQYWRRTIAPIELLAAVDHLAICDDCRRRAAHVVGAKDVLPSVQSSLHAEIEHVSYEQMASFVDGQLTAADRESVESHLKLCGECADEVSDLQNFRMSMATAPQTTDEPPAKTTFRERLSAFWSTSWSPRFATASIAAVLLVLVAGALIVMWKTRVSNDRSSTEVASVPSPSPEAPTQANAGNENTGSNESSSNDSTIAIELNDAGGRITLDKQGNITGLDALAPSAKSAVARALTAERVEQSQALAELNPKAGVLLGEQGKNSESLLVSPVGTVVRDDQPRFRWRALNGASSYTVNILDADFNVVSTSPPLTVTTWTPPSRLARGRVFSWQVETIKEGQKLIFPSAPSPEARFKILESDKTRELIQAEQTKPRSHLALGVLYARAGLIDDAERELRALVTTNPQSTTARRLLRSIGRK